MTIETREKYCPSCGKAVNEPTFNCFGEWACSEAYAEQYVKEVRTQKIQAASGEQFVEKESPEQARSRRDRGGCC